MSETARRMWIRFETYHDVTYFTPESRSATDGLGCRGGWMGYFGMRAAPLGAVSAAAVASAFYNFHPGMVARAIPEAWHIAAPARFLKARVYGVDGALQRLLGEETLASAEVAEAAELARSAAELAPTAGRPLAAANAVLGWPRKPHLVLWQATTLLRESRGDGHIAALVAADLDPCEALVLFSTSTGLSPEYLQKARGWSPSEWQEAHDRLVGRALVDDSGRLSESGAELRAQVEETTDRAAAHPWTALGAERAERLSALLAPLARTIVAGNEVMKVNPMALDAAAELT